MGSEEAYLQSHRMDLVCDTLDTIRELVLAFDRRARIRITLVGVPTCRHT